MDRRTWMVSLLAGSLARVGRCADAREDLIPKDVLAEAASVAAAARRNRLRPVGASGSAHYLAIGDADRAFRTEVLKTCEAHFQDFLDHFRRKGFPLVEPADRMTVVTLLDPVSYAKYVGEPLASLSGGVYQPGSNRIVVYDQGHSGAEFRVPWRMDDSPWVARMTCLSHEVTHQLTFNTGLLNRWGDAPRCIQEGLAMYGELRSSEGRGAIGQLHYKGLDDLWSRMRMGTKWIPLSHLIVDDNALRKGLYDTPERALDILHAHTLSWLLVHTLLTDRVLVPRFRAYLKAIYGREDRRHRLADAEAHLGPLDQLERAVQRLARRTPRAAAFAAKAESRPAVPGR
jgi:hypothetical protein